MSFEIVPIGHVDTHNKSSRYIQIDDQFWKATIHLELFSHLIILWWIHEHDNLADRSIVIVTPPRHKGSEPSGVFACRSPSRPNPIGHSVVKLLNVDEKNMRLHLDQIDAIDGSPVIDIKPYLPSSDRVDSAKVAPWFEDLARRYAK